jgi:hypothetical protein
MTTTIRTPMHAASGKRRVAGADGWLIAPLASANRTA